MRDTETGSSVTGMSIETDDVEALLDQASAQVSGDTSAANLKSKGVGKPRIGGDVKKLGDFGGGLAIQSKDDLAALMNSERPAAKKSKMKSSDIIFHLFVIVTMTILAVVHLFLI